MRATALFFCCLLALLCPSKGYGQAIVLDSAATALAESQEGDVWVWEDTSKNATAEMANSQTFSKITHGMAFRHDAVYWGKVKVKSNISRDTDWWLAIQGDLVQAYLYKADGRVLSFKSGRFQPAEGDPELRFRTPLPLEANEEATILYRVESVAHYPPSMRVSVHGKHAVSKRISEHRTYQGFFQGILWIMAVYNLLTFFSTKDRSYLYYVVYLISGSVYFFYLYGFIALYVVPAVPRLETYIWLASIYGSALSYLLFMRQYFHVSEVSAKADRALKYVIWLGAGLFLFEMGVLAYSHNIPLVRNLNLLAMSAATIVAVWAVWQIRHIKSPIFTLFVVGASTYIVSILIFFYALTMANLGWLKGVSGVALSYLVEFGLVTEVVCFSIGLGLRMQQNEKAKRQAQEALIAQLEANRQIQEHYSQSLEMKVRERTAEIALQKEEIEAQKESIQHQNELLEHKNIELQALNEEKNHLMGVLAHDLRNPLTSGLTVANLLKEESDLLHPDHLEYADHLHRSLARMEEMIASALQQTADEATRLKLNWEEVDLGQLAKQSLQEQMGKAQAKQLTFNCQCEPVQLTLDRQYALRIIDNLISNAIKYSPIGGHVQVAVTKVHNKVQLRVADQGPGIAADEMPKLFRKFQRLSSKPTAGETSTGLGLSIVKKYAEAMGGQVGCESILGQGSSFWVVFELE